MDDPVTALLGVLFIAFGLTVVYGAFKNKKVLGLNGIIPTALTTGSLADLSKIPDAFPDFSLTSNGPPKNPIQAAGNILQALGKDAGDFWKELTGDQVGWLHPLPVIEAVASISLTDSNTARGIGQELDKMGPGYNTTRLSLLLKVADANGHKPEADIIRDYVRTVIPNAAI